MDHDLLFSIRKERCKKIVLGALVVLLVGAMGVYYTFSIKAEHLQALQLPGAFSVHKPLEKNMKEDTVKDDNLGALNGNKQLAREFNQKFFNVEVGTRHDRMKSELGHHGKESETKLQKKYNVGAALNDDKRQSMVKAEEDHVDTQLANMLNSELDQDETKRGDDFRRTTKARISNLDLLPQAAMRIKSSYIPPFYRFFNEIYFNPPKSNEPLDLPRVLQNPTHVCSQESGRETFLLVLVLSSHLENGAKEREAIRSTYGSVANGHQWPSKSLAAPLSLVFLLGRPPPGVPEMIVRREIQEHGDVVIADFVDSYHNLTLKVLVGLRWALQHCPQAQFILKTDDDTFVNLPLLTVFLSRRGQNNSLYGTPYFASKVAREGRWAVPEWAFPFPVYPVYMSGTGYVMSKDAAEKILEASKTVPLIPIEDAYVTGILAQVGQIRRMFCSGFTHHIEEKPGLCDFMLDKRLIGNRMPAAEKKSMWAKLRINDRRFC